MRGMKLPRFSLRTLFVLLTLISILMAWVAWSFHRISEREALQKTIGIHFIPGKKAHLPLSLKLFGALSIQTIHVHPMVPERIYQRIVVAFPEANVSRAEISDPKIIAIENGRVPPPWKAN